MDHLYVYETCVTDKILNDNTKFICLDFIDLEEIEKHKHKEVIAFISIQTRYKMEKLGFNFHINYNPEVYTTKYLISFFNDYTLTGDMVLLPYGAILNGFHGDEFFIRPNAGTKYFPGCTVKYDEFDVFNNTYKIPKDLLCARSSIIDIVSEKRVFLSIKEKRIITESLYSHNKYDNSRPDFNVTDICSEILKVPEIDMLPDVVVADFALLLDNTVKLVEFNYAMTSGIYGCDMNKIIETYNNT
ncbi:MAG: hypothetical protein [Caudoviricetes sp.]|nr:MAG: hypothetical protein [Caudoviricetes sp.]